MNIWKIMSVIKVPFVNPHRARDMTPEDIMKVKDPPSYIDYVLVKPNRRKAVFHPRRSGKGVVDYRYNGVNV